MKKAIVLLLVLVLLTLVVSNAHGQEFIGQDMTKLNPAAEYIVKMMGKTGLFRFKYTYNKSEYRKDWDSVWGRPIGFFWRHSYTLDKMVLYIVLEDPPMTLTDLGGEPQHPGVVSTSDFDDMDGGVPLGRPFPRLELDNRHVANAWALAVERTVGIKNAVTELKAMGLDPETALPTENEMTDENVFKMSEREALATAWPEYANLWPTKPGVAAGYAAIEVPDDVVYVNESSMLFWAPLIGLALAVLTTVVIYLLGKKSPMIVVQEVAYEERRKERVQ